MIFTHDESEMINEHSKFLSLDHIFLCLQIQSYNPIRYDHEKGSIDLGRIWPIDYTPPTDKTVHDVPYKVRSHG
jgi:hypothetical protein